MEPVKISALELENVKRIRAVQIVPTKDGLTVIGGRNGQGKTTVLDAIAWALGGKKYQPDNPTRDGAAMPAKLHVELSNGIVVERRGKNATLHVTDTTGMRGTQKLLDEFMSQLALDLPKFLGGTDRDRTNALLATLGIDQELSRIDSAIKAEYDRRTFVGKDAKAKRAHATSLPRHDDAPDEPVSVAELIQQQQEILARNGENKHKREQVSRLEWELQSTERELTAIDLREQELRRQLDAIADERKQMAAKKYQIKDDLETAHKTADELVDESTAEIEQSIANIELMNAHVRDNQRKLEAETEAEKLEREYQSITATIEQLRESRVSLLDGAPLPLEGLSVNEDMALTYNGQTWGDMSGSEQLRVATAIVRATKPECGFVLVDKLEQMDSQTLAEFGEWAKSEGLQVIGTRVSTGEECSIIIEDGRVDGQDIPEPTPPNPKGEALSWGGDSF